MRFLVGEIKFYEIKSKFGYRKYSFVKITSKSWPVGYVCGKSKALRSERVNYIGEADMDTQTENLFLC